MDRDVVIAGPGWSVLRSRAPRPAERTPIVCEPALHWIAPNVMTAGAEPPPRGRFALRAHAFLRAPRIEIVQGGRTLWSGRLARPMPGRSTAIPHGWTQGVEPGAGAIRVRLSRRG